MQLVLTLLFSHFLTGYLILLFVFAHTHLPSLFQLSEHYYRAASPLPDHPPEVLYGVLQGPLARHVRILLTVAL